jgi:hemoglobin
VGEVFASMDPHHAEHVAAFVTEVLGGAQGYTGKGGSHAGMILRHMGRHLGETQRRRWIEMMLDTADEVGLPSDPEFRSAFVAYLKWGTRLAVINSQDGAQAPPEDAPMPQWGWGVPGGPYRG